jgi:predicted O-linked N-acetylglucosamine transferase (SPINDLY family)
MKAARNDPCPCGSGKKYKQCCMQREQAQAGNSSAQRASSQALLQTAMAHHRAGRLPQAEAIYQQILQADPGNADALHMLGLVAAQVGSNESAITLFQRAIAAKPDDPSYHCNLGHALQASGRLEPAVASYRSAIALRRGYANYHASLAEALTQLQQWEPAAESFRATLAIEPGNAQARYGLGFVLRQMGQHEEAIRCYQQALAANPKLAAAHNDLGTIFKLQDRIDDAIASYRRALALVPDNAEWQFNLGAASIARGDRAQALASFRRAVALRLGDVEAYSDMLFLSASQLLLDPAEYLDVARGWGQSLPPAAPRRFELTPLAERRLRVGYVSADFYQHAISYFMEPLLAAHDRDRVEIFVYASNAKVDLVTERLQSLAEHWLPAAGLSHAALAERIVADRIDVLVDLSGHTAHNRLPVLAARVAPVQAHYLGFFASTGLREMDYWIGDEAMTPATLDAHFSEQVWRLPRTTVTYGGNADAPQPAWQPAADGSVWLGSFHAIIKLTPETLALWARLLQALPEAKLLLKTREFSDAAKRQRIFDALVAFGADPSRVELRDGSATPSWAEHMAYYDRLDIALDPVGTWSGNTTTCDALWMGVPVIGLNGDRSMLRMTAPMLDALGHPEWSASSEDEYVDKVVALARAVDLRRQLRATQRARMAASPLCDAAGLARALENAYIDMYSRRLSG